MALNKPSSAWRGLNLSGGLMRPYPRLGSKPALLSHAPGHPSDCYTVSSKALLGRDRRGLGPVLRPQGPAPSPPCCVSR